MLIPDKNDDVKERFRLYLDWAFAEISPDDLEPEGPPQADMSTYDFYFVVGRLWDCTDVLPIEYCSLLDFIPGTPYWRAARKVNETILAHLHTGPTDEEMFEWNRQAGVELKLAESA